MVFFEKKTQNLEPQSIYAILRGPLMPDTEDVGYQTFTIEDDSKSSPLHSFYERGEVVKWVYYVEGAEIEIKGCLLSVRSRSALISEWGVSVPQRYWIVSLNKLSKADPS